MKERFNSFFNNKIIMTIAFIIAIFVIIVGVNTVFKVNKIYKDSINNQNNVSDNNINSDNEEQIPTETPTITPIPTITSTPTMTPDTTHEYKEEDVIDYFEDADMMFSSYASSTISKSTTEKLRNAFKTITDFIFNDGEIKEYKFNELSDTSKIKILKTAANIDNKIDTYFPNYKDSIRNGISSIKAKVIVLYLETTTSICKTIGESACNEARNDFKIMKESFGLTLTTIKEIASSSSSALIEWYNSIK